MNSTQTRANAIMSALLSKDKVQQQTPQVPAQNNGPLPLAELKKLCNEIKNHLTLPLEQGGWGLDKALFAMEKGKRTLLTVEPYMEYAKDEHGKIDFNTVVKHSNTILLKDAGYQVHVGNKSFWTGGNSWTLGFAKADDNGVVSIVEPWANAEQTSYHERQVVVQSLFLARAQQAKAAPQQNQQ